MKVVQPKIMKTNRWDSMLAWLSSMPEHKWHNVKAASQRLSAIEFPSKEWTPRRHASEWAGVLIDLGHAEYDPIKKVVTALPPGLITFQASKRAILYGYWSPSRRKTLIHLGYNLQRHIPRRGPTRYTISTDEVQLPEIADEIGVWIASDCSLDLLQRLPTISNLLEYLEPRQFSSDGYWERFDYRTNLYGRWWNCDQPLIHPGLYQCKDGQAIQVWVDDTNQQFRLRTMDEKMAAKWWVDQPRSYWWYDSSQRNLLIPYGTPRLPVLVSRGLTMEAATLPTRFKLGGRRWWKYRAVGAQQAKEAARIMERTLEHRNFEDV